MDRKREGKPPEEPPEESDEELLREYEWAEKHVPDDVTPKPAPDEFERTWERIQEERGK